MTQYENNILNHDSNALICGIDEVGGDLWLVPLLPAL